MNLIIRSSLQYSIKNCQRQRNLNKIFNNPTLRTQRTLNKNPWYQFCSQNKDQSNNNNNEKNKEKIDWRLQKQKREKFSELSQKYQSELQESVEDGKKYSVVNRNYNQEKVPGLETRKYSNLSQLQQDIVKSNTFDIQNPQIIPKTGASNSYIGVTSDLTEISLGGVKVKGNNEVFLSQIDPENIPADLDIRFDSQKQLKIVGRESSKIKPQKNTNVIQKQGKTQMSIQPETIEQKTISEHMQEQFGFGIKSYGYENVKKLRRWDIFLSLLAFTFLIPIVTTLGQLHQCYSTTKAIEEERMKEINQLKQRSYQRVLLQNKDFRNVQ